MSSVAAGLQNASRTLLTASGDGAEQSEKPRTCTHRELSPHCLWGQEVAGGAEPRSSFLSALRKLLGFILQITLPALRRWFPAGRRCGHAYAVAGT